MDVDTWQREMADLCEQAAMHAPYKIVKRGDSYAVMNNIGETKATFKTRGQALKYQRALYVSVPGAAKRAAHVKWTPGKGVKKK